MVRRHGQSNPARQPGEREQVRRRVPEAGPRPCQDLVVRVDRKSTRLNSSHGYISYAVFCLKKKYRNSIIYSSCPPSTHVSLPRRLLSSVATSPPNQPPTPHLRTLLSVRRHGTSPRSVRP